MIEQNEKKPSLSLKTQDLITSVLERVELEDDEQGITDLAELRYCFDRLSLDYPAYTSKIRQSELATYFKIIGAIKQRLESEEQNIISSIKKRVPPSDGTIHEKARLRGVLALEGSDLANRVRDLTANVPPWVDAAERTITRIGALQWRQLRVLDAAPPESMVVRSELRLLARFAQCVEPLPPWVARDLNHLLLLQWQHAVEHNSHTRCDAVLKTCAVLAETIELDPSLKAMIGSYNPSIAVQEATDKLTDTEVSRLETQLRDLVADWLEEARLNAAGAELGLVYVPGARIAPHSRQQLDLNLAAIRAPGQQPQSPAACKRLIEVYFSMLKDCPTASRFRLREPVASLYESVSQAWRTGEQISANTFGLLGEAITTWNRCGGPGALGAELQPARWPVAQLSEGQSIVVPTKLEMGSLHCVLQHPAADIEDTLAAIRRNHHNRDWMTGDPSQAGLVSPKLEDQLRWLHTRSGFYASTLMPMECMNRWSSGVFSALLNLQVVGVEIDPWFFAAVQKVFEETGRVLELHRWPDHQHIYDFLAGREVLVVSPLAEQIEAQHRSGKAFDLFEDLTIRPYGLRSFKPPDSIWPNRPQTGYCESLDYCLDEIDSIYRELPFSVMVINAGAFSLPICDAINSRYGVSCLHNESIIHGYFGISTTTTANWRLGQRKKENWTQYSVPD